jgi:hypothetical protein
VVGRHLGYQEREFLRHVYANKVLLGYVGVAISVREDHVYDLTGTAEARGTGPRGGDCYSQLRRITILRQSGYNSVVLMRRVSEKPN